LLQRTLNLGILAHVDAGKTTLTERLLYAAGVIDAIGSVDAGTTQTDSLALERQRGITIKSAVVSFAIDDVIVNLIDTPGHPDFIAEVERVLSVLDGAVLVVSAVEGVQPQTRVLMRALQRLRIPTLLFVNKIDRPGAGDERVLQAISDRLAPAIIPMGLTRALGTRAADFIVWGADDPAPGAALAELLAEGDEVILAAFVENDVGVSYGALRQALATQTKRALVHPVFFGSAITGAGVEPLMAGMAELLPTTAGDDDGPVSGTVFKIERGAGGARVAYVRMFSGTVRTRERVRFGRDLDDKVTAVGVFERGSVARRTSVSAGEIGKLWGLDEIQVGDWIGAVGTDGPRHRFAPPTLESVVVACNPDDRARLRVALGQLAEQDPLINVRQEASLGEMSVSLYGEVQKEVIQATLANDFGIDVIFRETTTIYIERPVGTGQAVEVLFGETNPYVAGIGLRVDRAPTESGVKFQLDIDIRSVPLYIYKTAESFFEAIAQYVRGALHEGLRGWEVTDCTVTMNACEYYVGDGAKRRSRSTSGPIRVRASRTTAADFRKLTPLVLMLALERAGTVVCEPMIRVSIEMPTDAVGAVLAAVARLGGVVAAPSLRGDLYTIETVLPAARAQDLRRQLPGLTSGEGVVETTFSGYQPVTRAPLTRRRVIANPINRDEHMMHLARRAIGAKNRNQPRGGPGADERS
jgi:ribosomal protection tetracycline resistance protein